MQTYNSPLGYTIQLPTDIMNQLKITEGSSKIEEGNPPTTFFYYKDPKQNKEILLLSVIRLTKEQENTDYYKEHPFLKKVGSNDRGSFFYVVTSEHPYGENENSIEGKQWSYLVDVLKERLQNS